MSSTTLQTNAKVPDATTVPSVSNDNTTIFKAYILPSLAPEIKIPASNRPSNDTNSSDNNGPNFEWDGVDLTDDERNKTLIHENITTIEEDFHEYYNSTLIQNENHTNLHRENIYARCSNLKINPLLSKSHRRAITVTLPFEFPFYGEHFYFANFS